MGSKIWILLAGIWVCNSKNISFEASNEEINSTLLDCCSSMCIKVK